MVTNSPWISDEMRKNAVHRAVREGTPRPSIGGIYYFCSCLNTTSDSELAKHQQADGFTIYASKTIAVPVDVLFDAFVNPRSRRKWLTDGTMSLRTSQPGHTARFNWGDGATRVSVSFEGKGPSKSAVAVAHERLPDADEAETTKLSWRERLSDLKSFLES